MESAISEMLLPSEIIDVQMQDNQDSVTVNGTLPNGHGGYVDPRVLSSVKPNDFSEFVPEDEVESSSSSSSEDTKVGPDCRQSWLPTGCCYDDRMKLHSTGDYSESQPHPEDPRRIESIMRAFRDSGLIYSGDEADLQQILRDSPTKYMWRIAAREARKDEICTMHTAMHYDWVESLDEKSVEEIALLNSEMDTGRKSLYVSLCTYGAALIAAGGAIETCKHVVEGNVKNAIAVIRPPGHHAESNESLGFCIFNNVPIAAKVCMLDYPDTCRKVLILDWDIHHGNGTQNMYYDNPNVLYISLHVYDDGKFYPGQPEDDTLPDGGLDKIGFGAGVGKNVNIGWPGQGVGDGEYMAAFQRIVMPIAQEFDPDLVIVSAGFDAAAGDELGGCFVTPACYSHMTHMLMSLAGGKVAVCLEGGYNLAAISRSALSVAKTLMGEPPERMSIPPLSKVGAEVFQQVSAYHAPYWECMRSGIANFDAAKASGATRIDDVVRTYQRNMLTKNFNMASLYIQRTGLTRAFENQVLVTPLHGSAKQILFIIHDPPEILASPDPATAQVASHNAYMLDPIPPYIEWAVKNGFEVIDVNMPLTPDVDSTTQNLYPNRPSLSQQENQSKELVCYLWDNYLELYPTNRFLFLGIGDSYLGIKQLLQSRDCRRRIIGILCFVTGALRSVRSDTDNELSAWYKKNSMIYLSNDHLCWSDEKSLLKINKKSFGGVRRSEEASLPNMMTKHRDAAQEWMMGKLQQKVAEEGGDMENVEFVGGGQMGDSMVLEVS